MIKLSKPTWFAIAAAAFVVYVFVAARPIPPETVLTARWLSSLESGLPVSLGPAAGGTATAGTANDGLDAPLPFRVGDRYGYVADGGRFVINQRRSGLVSISPWAWAEYDPVPDAVQIRDPQGATLIDLEKPGGYPVLLDNRVFLLGPDQSSLTALDDAGAALWTYEFPAPLTCVDAAAGLVLAGTLDGVIELIDDQGRQAVTPFEPGGSRLSVILGCALSADGAYLAVISGIDDQRFLLLERAGGACRVIYHEFLTDGFRRPVRVAFIDHGGRVAYEREGGIGVYDIASRVSVFIPLDGEIAAMDDSGADGVFFAVTSQGGRDKRLVAVRLPGTVLLEAPFKSERVFLGRRGPMIYVGGDKSLAAFAYGVE